MGFTLFCGGPRRRRRTETPVPASQNGRQSRQVEARKRDTLHKKMPTAPVIPSPAMVSKSEEEDATPSVVELDVETPTRMSVDVQVALEAEEPSETAKKGVSEPPDGCVELAADPPAMKPPKPAKEPLNRPEAGKEQSRWPTHTTVAETRSHFIN